MVHYSCLMGAKTGTVSNSNFNVSALYKPTYFL